MGAVSAVYYTLNEEQWVFAEALASISALEYSVVLSIFILRDLLHIASCFSVIDWGCPKSFQTCRSFRRKLFNDVSLAAVFNNSVYISSSVHAPISVRLTINACFLIPMINLFNNNNNNNITKIIILKGLSVGVFTLKPKISEFGTWRELQPKELRLEIFTCDWKFFPLVILNVEKTSVGVHASWEIGATRLKSRTKWRNQFVCCAGSKRSGCSASSSLC